MFLRISIFCLANFFAASELMAVSLDQMMTPADKEQTGYSSLNAAQRQALDTWVGQNFSPKSSTSQAQGVKKGNSKIEYSTLSLSLNIDSGQKLILSDNSQWEVAPSDVHTAFYMALASPNQHPP